MGNRRGFEYRANLPRTLELVHKQSALKVLGRLGITLAEDANWREIYGAHEKTDDKHIFIVALYNGFMEVGPIFGKNDWVLSHSMPTEQSLDLYGEHDNYDRLYAQSEIHIENGKDKARLFLLPDMPPVAVYEDDIDYVHRTDGRLGESPTEAGIIAGVQRAFDSDAVDFISEAAAKRVMNALRNDNPHTAPN